MCFQSKKANKKMEKELGRSADDPPPKPARSPPRSGDQRKDSRARNSTNNLRIQPFKTPPPLVSDPNFARQSEIKRKKHGKKDGEDSDNTLTD
ncbi:hypothetical protein OSTOST_21789, partial [Ostertagia ostertagi]